MDIRGQVVFGTGLTRYNILLQMPSLDVPNMYRLHAGTINVDIHALRFRVRHTPYRFRAVNWGHQIEDIELIPVSGMVHNGYQLNVTAYLYLPAMSRNRRNGRILEIWSEKIGPVSPGDRFELTIPEGCLEVG